MHSHVARFRSGVIALAFAFSLTVVSAETASAQAPAPKAPQAQPAKSTPQAAKTTAPSRATPTTVKPVATTKRGVYRLPTPPKNFTPPLIKFGSTVHDWGTVVRGSTVKHSFQVQNAGGSPLIIDKVKPQCGCTAVDKPENPIAPGASATITLSIDTKRFKGPLKKTAKVHSNASPEPVVLTMSGSVEQVFGAEPDSPKIEIIRGEPKPSGKVTLRRLTKNPAKILEVTSASAIIKPTLKAVKEGDLYEVTLDVDLTDNKRSYFYENISAKVETNGEIIELPVRVTLLVKDRIDVSPKSAYFPRKETGALSTPNAPALTKEIVIRSLGSAEHKFEITGIENPTGAFETRTPDGHRRQGVQARGQARKAAGGQDPHCT